jgi:hypothetical protein
MKSSEMLPLRRLSYILMFILGCFRPVLSQPILNDDKTLAVLGIDNEGSIYSLIFSPSNKHSTGVQMIRKYYLSGNFQDYSLQDTILPHETLQIVGGSTNRPHAEYFTEMNSPEDIQYTDCFARIDSQGNLYILVRDTAHLPNFYTRDVLKKYDRQGKLIKESPLPKSNIRGFTISPNGERISLFTYRSAEDYKPAPKAFILIKIKSELSQRGLSKEFESPQEFGKSSFFIQQIDNSSFYLFECDSLSSELSDIAFYRIDTTFRKVLLAVLPSKVFGVESTRKVKVLYSNGSRQLILDGQSQLRWIQNQRTTIDALSRIFIVHDALVIGNDLFFCYTQSEGSRKGMEGIGIVRNFTAETEKDSNLIVADIGDFDFRHSNSIFFSHIDSTIVLVPNSLPINVIAPDLIQHQPPFIKVKIDKLFSSPANHDSLQILYSKAKNYEGDTFASLFQRNENAIELLSKEDQTKEAKFFEDLKITNSDIKQYVKVSRSFLAQIKKLAKIDRQRFFGDENLNRFVENLKEYFIQYSSKSTISNGIDLRYFTDGVKTINTTIKSGLHSREKKLLHNELQKMKIIQDCLNATVRKHDKNASLGIELNIRQKFMHSINFEFMSSGLTDQFTNVRKECLNTYEGKKFLLTVVSENGYNVHYGYPWWDAEKLSKISSDFHFSDTTSPSWEYFSDNFYKVGLFKGRKTCSEIEVVDVSESSFTKAIKLGNGFEYDLQEFQSFSESQQKDISNFAARYGFKEVYVKKLILNVIK